MLIWIGWYFFNNMTLFTCQLNFAVFSDWKIVAGHSKFVISRILHSYNITMSQSKPLISRQSQTVDWPFVDKVVWIENWSKVHFNDDRKLNLFRSSGKHYVYIQTANFMPDKETTNIANRLSSYLKLKTLK